MNTSVNPDLSRYTVEYLWPMYPHAWHGAVRDVPEPDARSSAAGLRDCRYAFRVRISFFRGRGNSGVVCERIAAEWDREGNLSVCDLGDLSSVVPDWVKGFAPLEE